MVDVPPEVAPLDVAPPDDVAGAVLRGWLPVLSVTEPEPVTVPPPAPEPEAVPVALQPASEPKVAATIMQISIFLLMFSSIEPFRPGGKPEPSPVRHSFRSWTGKGNCHTNAESA
ncbi:hypothetical protein AWV79_22275 [Cupriavidus sp. UYMMa02A]|nr:hypothetical protein AWV80_30605 [Cupriavidus sp. UYMU48A]ODV42920.1 hypothetical protein AWV79_22275 [Cupriavidus sp. UYMMa02A]